MNISVPSGDVTLVVRTVSGAEFDFNGKILNCEFVLLACWCNGTVVKPFIFEMVVI
jgi:hypothetical protein